MKKYRDVAQDNKGNAIVSATITVTDNPGGAVSAVYSDNILTVLANPFTSSAIDGAYEFYAENGKYDITVVKAGFTTETIKDISLLDVAEVIESYSNIAALRAITIAPIITLAKTKGYTTDGDGGGADYYWDTTSTSTDDGGAVIKATAVVTGRWKLLYNGAINAKWYGAKGDNGVTDNTAFIQAGIDFLEANGGGVVYVPSGIYKTTSTLFIRKSGVFIRCDGPKATIFTPNFDTTAFLEIDSPTLIERAGIFNCEISHSVTRTLAAPTIIFGRGQRLYATDVEVVGARVGLQYGYDANPGETVNGNLTRFRANTTSHGIIISSQAALFINNTTLNGVVGNGSSGILINGFNDGLWVDDNSTIETHDTGLYIGHSSGSCANTYLNGCAIDRLSTFGVRIEPTGTGSVNGVHLNGVKFFDTVGSGNADMVHIGGASSGSINNIELKDVFSQDARQRFFSGQKIITGLSIVGCVTKNGSAKSSGTYSAIDLGGLAHDRVTITGNEIQGINNYALYNASLCTNITVTGNNFNDVVTSPMNTVGLVSKTRHFGGNTGVRDLSSYLIGPATTTNLQANVSSATGLILATSDGTTIGFFESHTSFVAIRAGRVSALTIASREARSAGTATFTVYVNAVIGTLSCILNATNPQYVVSTQDSGDTFAAGDRVGIKYVTDASWAPITTEIAGWLEIEETTPV